MKTHEVFFGWKIMAHEKLVILTNSDGLVAVTATNTHFGDNQVLLLQLHETGADIGVLPHYLKSVNVTMDKVITIITQPFFDEVPSFEDSETE